MLHVYYLKIYGQMLNVVLNLLHLPSRYVLHPSLPCSVPSRLNFVPCLLDFAWVWPMRGGSSQSENESKERWGCWFSRPSPHQVQVNRSCRALLSFNYSSLRILVTTPSSYHGKSAALLRLLALLIYLNSAHTLQIVHSLSKPNYQGAVCHLFPARTLSATSNIME